MPELTQKIGSFDKDKRTVPVTFTSGEVVHKRDVNAVLKPDGSYDRAATRDRVDEVALGVKHKIGLGLITVPVAEPDVGAEPVGEAASSAD